MKYKYWKAFGVGLLAMGLVGCGWMGLANSTTEGTQSSSVQQEVVMPKEPEARAKRIMKSMTDAEKVGQLMMVGIHGTQLNDDSKYLLNEYQMGGVILFDRNMETKEQVQKLNENLLIFSKKNMKAPVLIAVDQEGGIVARMQDHLVTVPKAEILGQEPVDIALDYANQTAKELRDLNFSVNFAPVVDMGLDHGRSFSADNPADVVKYAGAVAKAYERNELLFSFKHFPGIGRGTTDLHVEGNAISGTKEELLKQELYPFAQLIPQFDHTHYMVMVSHSIYPSLDDAHPASLSKVIMEDVLRKDLGFQGVIVTDDLEMGAVSNHHTFRDMAVASVKAGADIVLICHEYDHMIDGYNGLLQAVRSGEISKERLDEAVYRVLLMKCKRGIA